MPGDYQGDSHDGYSKPDLRWTALTPSIILTSLSTIAVFLRLFTRFKLAKTGGFNDGLIVVSLLLIWTCFALLVTMLHHGFGTYTWQDDLDMRATMAKLFMGWNICYVVLLGVTKWSLLAQYLRVFKFDGMRRAIWGVGVCVVPWVAWGVFGAVFLCTPIKKIWDPSVPGICLSTRNYWLSTTSVNIVLDLAVLILPIPAITTLRLPMRQKCWLIGVFMLGFFTCAVSLVRVALVHKAYSRHNYTKSSCDAVTWSMVEANTGIVCASLLALKPLIARLVPWTLEDGRPPRRNMTLPTLVNPSPPLPFDSAVQQRKQSTQTQVRPRQGSESPEDALDELTLVGSRQSWGGEKLNKVKSWGEETIDEIEARVKRPENVY